jgi:sugar/nucleoside kinase (ribokinase family)
VFDSRVGRTYHIPIVPVETVDSTGAGDGYCGGFAISYCQTGDALEAALRATVSASFVVQDFGALHALHINKAEAHRRLDMLRREVVPVTSNLWLPESAALQ